ncbi:MAG: rRNA pseudouridine synthase [Proteobacteria bacterium]|nr:rRNA pseudouridine synthase [Pseudomonadota bacterium]
MSIPRHRAGASASAGSPRHGLARALSKLGLASRTVAAGWIADGRVAVNGRVRRNPEFPVVPGRDRIGVDGREIGAQARICLMLNKPRGLVTTANDERGRDTVYRCLAGAGLPWLMPVGRLDKASEGLLLFCNDPAWAARITDPDTGPVKTYHVQIDAIPDAALLERLVAGVDCGGERLCAKFVSLLRHGAKHAWLDIVLDEGRNRQIRRLLAAQGIGVLRLVRVAIGPLQLGALGKGAWRMLSAEEIEKLR